MTHNLSSWINRLWNDLKNWLHSPDALATLIGALAGLIAEVVCPYGPIVGPLVGLLATEGC
jgi:hypothetical protein